MPSHDSHPPTAAPDPYAAASAVEGYLENLERNVPGVATLHALVGQLLAERVPRDGRVLVVGAGGGAEIAAIAGRHPGWTFDGVDPSRPMLDLAARTLAAHRGRVTLHEGVVDVAPVGPFDAATCLLTLHHLDAEQRARTLAGIRRRLRTGSPLVTFHHSVPAPPARRSWFERQARYAAGPDTDHEQIRSRATAMAERLPARTPDEDEADLVRAGFRDCGVFYAALSMRGWVAFA